MKFAMHGEGMSSPRGEEKRREGAGLPSWCAAHKSIKPTTGKGCRQRQPPSPLSLSLTLFPHPMSWLIYQATIWRTNKPSQASIKLSQPAQRVDPLPIPTLPHRHSLYSLALILLTARQLITRHNKFNNFATGRADCGSSSPVVVVACASTLRHDKHFN